MNSALAIVLLCLVAATLTEVRGHSPLTYGHRHAYGTPYVGHAHDVYHSHVVPHYHAAVPKPYYGDGYHHHRHHTLPEYGARTYHLGYRPAAYAAVHDGYAPRYAAPLVVAPHPVATPAYGHPGSYGSRRYQPDSAYSTVETAREDDGYGNGVHTVSHSVSDGQGGGSTVYKKQYH